MQLAQEETPSPEGKGVGVQVFIATHDFLLSHELSLAAEYDTPEGQAAKTEFFCLSRERSRGLATVFSGDTIADVPDNPILQEFSAHYERERRLFYQSDTGSTGGRT